MVAVVMAVLLVGAGCQPFGGATRTYAITVQETRQAAAATDGPVVADGVLTAAAKSQATLRFTVDSRGGTLRVVAVGGVGNPDELAAAQDLIGVEFPAVSPREPSGPGPSPLAADDEATLQAALTRVPGNVRAGIVAQMPAYEEVQPASGYQVAPPFQDLFGPPASFPPVTTTEVPHPGVLGTLGDLFLCATTVLTICPLTRTNTVAVPGPPELDAAFSGTAEVTVAHVVLDGHGPVVSAKGTGRIDSSGTLPYANGVPLAISALGVRMVTTWSYTTTLTSPIPRSSGHPWAAGLLGLAILLPIAAVAAVAGYRRWPREFRAAARAGGR